MRGARIMSDLTLPLIIDISRAMTNLQQSAVRVAVRRRARTARQGRTSNSGHNLDTNVFLQALRPPASGCWTNSSTEPAANLPNELNAHPFQPKIDTTAPSHPLPRRIPVAENHFHGPRLFAPPQQGIDRQLLGPMFSSGASRPWRKRDRGPDTCRPVQAQPGSHGTLLETHRPTIPPARIPAQFPQPALRQIKHSSPGDESSSANGAKGLGGQAKGLGATGGRRWFCAVFRALGAMRELGELLHQPGHPPFASVRQPLFLVLPRLSPQGRRLNRAQRFMPAAAPVPRHLAGFLGGRTATCRCGGFTASESSSSNSRSFLIASR